MKLTERPDPNAFTLFHDHGLNANVQDGIATIEGERIGKPLRFTSTAWRNFAGNFGRGGVGSIRVVDQNRAEIEIDGKLYRILRI